jgi:hypothetical protein
MTWCQKRALPISRVETDGCAEPTTATQRRQQLFWSRGANRDGHNRLRPGRLSDAVGSGTDSDHGGCDRTCGEIKFVSNSFCCRCSRKPMTMEAVVRVFPRARSAGGCKLKSRAIGLSVDILVEHFSSPLQVAAAKLGVCPTALKR